MTVTLEPETMSVVGNLECGDVFQLLSGTSPVYMKVRAWPGLDQENLCAIVCLSDGYLTFLGRATFIEKASVKMLVKM